MPHEALALPVAPRFVEKARSVSACAAIPEIIANVSQTITRWKCDPGG